MKKILCVLLIFSFALGICSCSSDGAGSPEKVAATMIEGLSSADPEMVVSTYPDFRVENFCESFGTKEVSREALALELAWRIVMAGGTGTDCVIVSTKRHDFDAGFDYEDAVDDLREYYDASTEDIKKVKDICIVDVNVFNNDSHKNETYEVLCVKMGNRWYASDIC